MEPCTCHISNLRCKNQNCSLLITARGLFKSEASKILFVIMKGLKQQAFSKKECIRALRREFNHKNQINHDLFDEIANQIWCEK